MWQDREIRFDVHLSYVAVHSCYYVPNSIRAIFNPLSYFSALDMRNGEVLIDSLANVEDTKANSGEGGTLMVTNLRLIWVSQKYSKTNLSK